MTLISNVIFKIVLFQMLEVRGVRSLCWWNISKSVDHHCLNSLFVNYFLSYAWHFIVWVIEYCNTLLRQRIKLIQMRHAQC